MARRKPRRTPDRGGHGRLRRRLAWLGVACVVLASALLVYAAFLDYRITTRFEGQRWALPAQVYARPLELYPGAGLSRAELVEELRRLGYRRVERPARPGTYRADAGEVRFVTRRFTFWDDVEPSRRLLARFDGERVVSVREPARGTEVALMRLEPPKIGSIYPRGGEDRVLVNLDQVPERLLQGLILVEDRRFLKHHGLDFIGIGRAALANLRALDIVQGGSTLTQQLVKNYFLTHERTFRRKFNEAIMAVLLEWHYSKKEILEAYLNEVYLGQDGSRAVHGFGLGSRLYFRKPLTELRLHEMALLVAVVRGPTYYDPRRHPERALERRNMVLDTYAELDALSASTIEEAKAQPLDVAETGIWQTSYPAFMDLVKRRLIRDYREDDLSSEGLRIFTTLDPRVQSAAERAVSTELPRLDARNGGDDDELEAAVVVTETDTPEVLALVGGRDPRYAGFNRTLQAKRPVGSLLKPAVYLTALENGYHLATPIEDTPVEAQLPGSPTWRPTNYSGDYHGRIPLYQGLVHSYNAATARLGMEIGVPRIIATLTELGMNSRPEPYPSVLLGAVDMSPLEVTQIYHTLAAGGFRSQMQVIRAVMTKEDEPLQRYPLSVHKAVDDVPNYLVVRLLQEVARRGTGRGIYRVLPESLAVAGKTGTTDEFRDSWFAGFTGNRLAVVWVGRDDNQPAGLTGASGALPVWRRLMTDIHPQPLALRQPDGVTERWIDSGTGLWADEGCHDAVELPFIEGTGPTEVAECARGQESEEEPGGAFDWLKGLFR